MTLAKRASRRLRPTAPRGVLLTGVLLLVVGSAWAAASLVDRSSGTALAGTSQADDYLLDVVVKPGPVVVRAQIGPWRIALAPPEPPGTLGSAIAALGRPVHCRQVGSPTSVDAEWARPVLAATFYTLGGGRPRGCARGSILSLGTATCFDTRCTTKRGLRVGHSLATLRRLYPRASTHRRANSRDGRDYWLVTTRCVVGTPGPCSPFTAHVAGNTVVSLSLRLGLGGD